MQNVSQKKNSSTPSQTSNGVNILALETSCDETAAAVLQCNHNDIKVLSNVVSSQVQLHAKWGGVVPNLAAREHLKNILPIIQESLDQGKVTQKEIDLIAVTRGPGLIPALLMGTTTAKTLSYLWKKPLLGIHHIEGHIYANFIYNKESGENEVHTIQFPLLSLVVSGGHTQLVLMKNHLQYDIIGETQDDAVGEAFDKTARILGLGYPGGPAISAEAEKYQKTNSKLQTNTKSQIQNPKQKTLSNVKCQMSNVNISLPRPMMYSHDFNFSFSGLKTAVLYIVKKFREENSLSEDDVLPKEFVQAVSHEFQQAAVDVLIHKTLKAAKKHNPKYILLAGGVSANKELRNQLGETVKQNFPNTHYLIPEMKYCIDNATMIGVAAYFRWIHMTPEQKSDFMSNWKSLQAQSNFSL